MGKLPMPIRAMARRGRPRVPINKKVRAVRIYLDGETVEVWQARHGERWRAQIAVFVKAMAQGWKNSK